MNAGTLRALAAHLRNAALGAVAVGMAGCAAPPAPLAPPPPPAAPEEASIPLGPATWLIEFLATEGTGAGLRLSGKLILVATSPEDWSPATRERASDENIALVPFFGALVVDLEKLGAPVNCGRHYPQIESLDPVRPGVLVETIVSPTRARTSVTDSVLWVGSARNIRRHAPNIVGTDEGCGVLMTITGSSREVVNGSLREMIAGTWSEAGLARNSRGTWTARLLQPLP